MPLMTTGEVIAQSLVLHGVDTVFGVPGAHIYDFNDALAESFGELQLRASSPDELRVAPKNALAVDAPVVIEVSVGRSTEASPWKVLHPASPD